MKKIFLSILIWILLFGSLSAQTSEDSSILFPVFVKGKYGYINAKGEMVVKPQFDKANKFQSGLALVEIEAKNISDTPGHYDYILGKQGYIDKTGKFVIEPGKFYLAEDFSEGLAGVGINDCRKKYCYGYIDTTGRVVIEPQFQTVSEFVNGTAGVRMPDDNWGVIDKKGTFIIPPVYDAAFPFIEGVGIGFTVRNKKETPFEQQIEDFEAAFYDRSGKITARIQNLVVGAFSEGLVNILTRKGVGFIDKSGKVVIQPQFEKAMFFSEGLCAVRLNKNWGFIDKSGKFIIEPQFTQAFSFSDGLAKVLTKEGYGFIDRNGKMKINPRKWDVGSFEDGLAFAYQDNVRGYIDQTGKFIWKINDE